METTLTKEKPISAEIDDGLEAKIRDSEKKLGIETEFDRLIEASLFIDKKFLSYALITGIVDRPERVFGSKAWADYLEGRTFAREYGNEELTVEFITELQKKLTEESDPKNSGKVRNVGVMGASYDGEGAAVTYTKEQIAAIEQNPQLTFKPVSEKEEDSTTGFIIYPHVSGIRTKEAVLKDLHALCEWYNTTRKEEIYNPHILAGLLQHRLISLHPFMDGNGRLSRVLMNWSLENDNQPPSVIDNPGEDILTDEETWIAQISQGSNQYKELKRKQRDFSESGIDNINALFNLGMDKSFYDYIFRFISEAPPLPTNGDKHKHEKYEEFLLGFKEEMERFQAYLHATSKFHSAGGEREISQGGLISPEFMQFALSTNLKVLSPEFRRQFFTDVEVYRGGMATGSIDEMKLCSMFQSYIGVGTGYRAIQRSGLPATSTQVINPQYIKESMDYYNKMFAALYFTQKHPEVQNPYAQSHTVVRDLNKTIQDHTIGGKEIWNSPFASTSLSYRISKEWAQNFYADFAKTAPHGVLFSLQLPREGTVLTFEKGPGGVTAVGIKGEKEALVDGGLHPAAINQIAIYDRDSKHSNPGLIAKRVEENGEVQLVVENRREMFVVINTYVFDATTRQFQLLKSEPTQIPSSHPVDEPERSTYIDTSKIFEPIDTKYISPLLKQSIWDKFDKKEFLMKNSIPHIPGINSPYSYLAQTFLGNGSKSDESIYSGILDKYKTGKGLTESSPLIDLKVNFSFSKNNEIKFNDSLTGIGDSILGDYFLENKEKNNISKFIIYPGLSNNKKKKKEDSF